MLTKEGAAKALRARAQYKPKPINLDPNFASQNAFILDPARFIDAQCSRRAGKTNGLAIRFFKTMEKYPKSQCLYLSLTFDSAKEIMWPVLQELNDLHNLGCTFVESKLTMTHPNGAKLKLMGADMKNFIKRLKGKKHPGIGVDESQDFGTHLQSLVDDVLTPCISDYKDGWLALTGTPGPVPQGFFFEVTQRRRYGFSHHEWTLYENPYMPDPQLFVADLKKKREWEDNNPTLLREWQNKWVLDVEALWIRYKETINDYATLPTDILPVHWNYILGIDIGFKDADALAVLAWSEKSPNTYLVKEVITARQGLTELVNQIHAVTAEFNISKMVIDEGGLGKKLAEEMRRQHGIPVEAAEKTRKQETVEFLNDALRTGRVRAKANSRFAQDSYLVQIDWEKSTPDRIIIKKKPHSDIIDAVIYAFKQSPAYAFQAPVKGPEKGTPEWYKAQESQMFNDAMSHYKELEDMQRRANGDYS